MKKEYEKPFIEIVELLVDEDLLAPIGGDMGESDMEEGWE